MDRRGRRPQGKTIFICVIFEQMYKILALFFVFYCALSQAQSGIVLQAMKPTLDGRLKGGSGRADIFDKCIGIIPIADSPVNIRCDVDSFQFHILSQNNRSTFINHGPLLSAEMHAALRTASEGDTILIDHIIAHYQGRPAIDLGHLVFSITGNPLLRRREGSQEKAK